MDFDLSYMVIEVKDNGIGIPVHKLSSIFLEKESDQSGDNWDGTGLGLPICLYICHQMRSFIRYTSVAQCTIFRFYVPY